MGGEMKTIALSLMAYFVVCGIATLAADNQPKLKPELALEIRTLQLQSSNLTIEMQRVAAHYLALERRLAVLEAQTAEKLSEAAKSSGVDLEKFDIDPSTLEVRTKPPRQEQKSKK